MCRTQIAKMQQNDSGSASQETQELTSKERDLKGDEALQDEPKQKLEEQKNILDDQQTRTISINDIPKQYQRLAKKSAKKAQNTTSKQSVSKSKQTQALLSKYNPKMCSEAISFGLQELEKQNYKEAIELFTSSLDLPGNGAYRFADSIREYSCPSDGEEQAALYNLTCCYAGLQQMESAIICLEGLLQSGFKDFQQLRTDPDLKFIQSTREFNDVLSKFDTPQNFIGKLFRGNKKKDSNQPGLLW